MRTPQTMGLIRARRSSSTSLPLKSLGVHFPQRYRPRCIRHRGSLGDVPGISSRMQQVIRQGGDYVPYFFESFSILIRIHSDLSLVLDCHQSSTRLILVICRGTGLKLKHSKNVCTLKHMSPKSSARTICKTASSPFQRPSPSPFSKE